MTNGLNELIPGVAPVLDLNHLKPAFDDCGLSTLCSSEQFQRAARLMTIDFGGITRKVPDACGSSTIPYTAHFADGVRILIEEGVSEPVLTAFTLHDSIEDLPHLWSKERIAREFSPYIAELVDWVTQIDKSNSWEIRNELYNKRLNDAPRDAVLISAADKISNCTSLNHWLSRGYAVSDILKRGWLENSTKFHELLGTFRCKIPDTFLVKKFSDALEAFDHLGPLAERNKQARNRQD